MRIGKQSALNIIFLEQQSYRKSLSKIGAVFYTNATMFDLKRKAEIMGPVKIIKYNVAINQQAMILDEDVLYPLSQRKIVIDDKLGCNANVMRVALLHERGMVSSQQHS